MTLHLSLYYLSFHLFEIQTFFSCFAMALKILNRPTCILKEVLERGSDYTQRKGSQASLKVSNFGRLLSYKSWKRLFTLLIYIIRIP